jgi:hypothetical protein
MKRACKNCYYSAPAYDEGLVVCRYLDDIIELNGTNMTKRGLTNAKSFVDSTNFSGDVFVAKDMDNELRICVSKNAKCGKFVPKSE